MRIGRTIQIGSNAARLGKSMKRTGAESDSVPLRPKGAYKDGR